MPDDAGDSGRFMRFLTDSTMFAAAKLMENLRLWPRCSFCTSFCRRECDRNAGVCDRDGMATEVLSRNASTWPGEAARGLMSLCEGYTIINQPLL